MYILIDFNDHDFCHGIKAGLQDVYDEGWFDLCPTIIKELITSHVVGVALKYYSISSTGYSYDTPMEYATHIYEYIMKTLRVTVEPRKPSPDIEFGDSAYGLDTNTGYIWYLNMGYTPKGN